MSSIEDIQEEFADLDIEVTDDDVLIRLKELCDRYNVDANKISCEYFSFNTKNKSSDAPTLAVLDTFENEKLKNLKISRRPLDVIEGAENLPDPTDAGQGKTPKKMSNLSKRNLTPETTAATKRFVSAVGSPSVHSQNSPGLDVSASNINTAAKYSERKNKGEIVLQHNKDAEGDWSPTSLTNNLTIVKSKQIVQGPYRFMFDSLRERAAVLDEVICKTTDLLTQRLQTTELMDIRSTQVEPQLAVGRICCDSDGHLNSNSVLLQASMDTSAGATMPLDLSRLEAFSLYPGQVVGVECTNPNGSRLQATKLYTQPPPALPEAPSNDQVLEVIVSCGPYTPQDSDSLQPLLDLLTNIKETQPHLAILIGPFVDEKNSAMEEMDLSYDEFFQIVLKEIYNAVEETRTQVILVPSQRDLHGQPVFPQPPANTGDARLWKDKIISMPDPAVFSVNGVSMGVTAADILFHLGKEEISYPPRSGDRFSRLAGYLLSQQCFYPLYPANLEHNMDIERMEEHANLPHSPHVLFTPSDLQYFVRDLPESSTVVNPGRITKGFGPGTYSHLHIQCLDGSVKVKAKVIRI